MASRRNRRHWRSASEGDRRAVCEGARQQGAKIGLYSTGPDENNTNMRRLVRILGFLSLALIMLAVLGAFSIFRASQQVPEFYAQALTVAPHRQAVAGDELERQALELNNQVRRPGEWFARFTTEQINGWLANDLPEKFPHILPEGVSQPRVSLEKGLAQIACHYDQGTFSTVIVLGIEPYLTDEPNTVAVRIRHARAGTLPVPLGTFLDDISARAAEAGVPLRWSQVDGDPIALVTIPERIEELKNRRLVIETVDVEDGEILLSGRTDAGVGPRVATLPRPAQQSIEHAADETEPTPPSESPDKLDDGP
jgi:hypothetical protein